MAECVRFFQIKVFHMVYAFSLLTLTIFVNDELNAQPLRYLRIRRNAYRDRNLLWPKAVVPYTLDESYTSREKRKIEGAMHAIESVSCIRFTEYDKEKAFIKIVRGTGCRAGLGYSGKRQKVILSPTCIFTATIIHELMHVLGFHHEHTRPDRDDYVTINQENIRSGEHSNFDKKPDSLVTTLDLPYDYRSVLHYSHKDFSIDRSSKTIEPNDEGITIGKARGLSPLDILKLNKLYHCPKQTHLVEEGSGDTPLEENLVEVSAQNIAI